MSLKNVQKSQQQYWCNVESIKSDVNVANVQCTRWKQTLRQLVSVAFCWDQNFTLSPITTRLDWDCVDSSYDSKEILSSLSFGETSCVAALTNQLFNFVHS